jgi:hypothetical protein
MIEMTLLARIALLMRSEIVAYAVEIAEKKAVRSLVNAVMSRAVNFERLEMMLDRAVYIDPKVYR